VPSDEALDSKFNSRTESRGIILPFLCFLAGALSFFAIHEASNLLNSSPGLEHELQTRKRKFQTNIRPSGDLNSNIPLQQKLLIPTIQPYK